MRIFIGELKGKGVCEKVINWFIENCIDGEEIESVVRKLAETDKNYIFWLVQKYNLTGLFSSYYKNGKTMNYLTYFNGKLIGCQECFHENGNIRCRKTYVNGLLHGPYERFFYNGKIKSSSLFVRGKIAWIS